MTEVILKLDGKDSFLDSNYPLYHVLLLREASLMEKGRVERDNKKADAISDELDEVRNKMINIENQARREGKLKAGDLYGR